MASQSWKKYVRHCLRCGKVGPRVHVGSGYVHKYCMTAEDKRIRKMLDEAVISRRKVSE